MKIIETLGIALLAVGLPTAMSIYVLSDRSCWTGIKRAAISVLILVGGMITLIPFLLGFGYFTLEDYLDDRATKQLMNGA